MNHAGYNPVHAQERPSQRKQPVSTGAPRIRAPQTCLSHRMFWQGQVEHLPSDPSMCLWSKTSSRLQVDTQLIQHSVDIDPWSCALVRLHTCFFWFCQLTPYCTYP